MATNENTHTKSIVRQCLLKCIQLINGHTELELEYRIKSNRAVIIELMGKISSSLRVSIKEDDVYKMKNIRKKKENDKILTLESIFSHNIKMS